MRIYMIAGLMTIGLSAAAQSAGEKAVMEPVKNLFLGMKAADSALVHSAFTRDVTFQTIARKKTGEAVLLTDDLKDFLKAVGTPHTEVWNEVIWGERVTIDGDFAQVWADYAFYIGNKFSHCGVDAFHLFRTPAGSWKIFHLADTRRHEGCNVPAAISDRFKGK